MRAFVRRWGAAALLLALVLLGFFLRVQGASTRSVDYDEIYLLRRSVLGLPLTDGPLAAFLLGYFVLLSDFSSEMLFLWSALMGSAAIAAFYALGLFFSGSKPFALACASFITFSPVSLFYAQKGRPYSLLLCVMCFMYLAFFRAWQKPCRIRWLMYSVAASLAAATHLVAIPVLVALSAAAVGIRFFWRQLALPAPPTGQSVCAVVVLSLIASLVGLADLHSEHSALPLVPLFSSYREGLLAFVRSLALGLSSTYQVKSGPLTPQDGVALVFVALAVYGLIRLFAEKRAETAIFLLSCLTISSVVMFLTLGCMLDGWAWLRYVSHLVIPFGLLVVHGLSELFRRCWTKHYSAATATALIMLVFPLSSIQSQAALAKYSAKGEGMRFKKFMTLPQNGLGVTVKGYITFLDRTADLLWLNSLALPSRPTVILLAGGRAKPKVLWQQDKILPPRSIVVPTYMTGDSRRIEPGLYAVVGSFAPEWRLPGCEGLAPHISAQLQVREIISNGSSSPTPSPNLKPLARACEVYAKQPPQVAQDGN